MRCPEVQPLLAEYSDGALPMAAHDAVAAHLERCAGCRKEHSGLERSRAVLDAVRPATAPDLWSGFSQRLAAQIPCADVAELLPAYIDGSVEGGRATDVRCHLENCATCAAKLAAFQRALGSLDHVASNLPQIDLWQAFAARLERERAIPLWRRWLPEAHPTWQPVLALGALLIGALIVRFGVPDRTVRIETPLAHTAAAPPVDRGSESANAEPRAARVAPIQPAPASPDLERHPRVRVARASRPQRRSYRRAHELLARSFEAPHAAPPREHRGEMVAHNDGIVPPVDAPAPETVAPPVRLTSAKIPDETLSQVEHALGMLVEIDEAAKQPFGSSEGPSNVQ